MKEKNFFFLTQEMGAKTPIIILIVAFLICVAAKSILYFFCTIPGIMVILKIIQ
jgi:hypothetical protein